MISTPHCPGTAAVIDAIRAERFPEGEGWRICLPRVEGSIFFAGTFFLVDHQTGQEYSPGRPDVEDALRCKPSSAITFRKTGKHNGQIGSAPGDM